MRRVYFALCVVGLLLPYSQLVPWVIEHGVDPLALARQAFETRISAFAWTDVIVSAVVVLVFFVVEGRRIGMAGIGWPVIGTLLVGVSFGLPLFLLMRETHLESDGGAAVGAPQEEKS